MELERRKDGITPIPTILTANVPAKDDTCLSHRERLVKRNFLDMRDKRDPEWIKDVSKWYDSVSSRSKTPEQQATLDDAYEKALQTGYKYRRGSSFKKPPKVKLDRNQVARIKHALRIIERGMFAQRGKGEHGLSKNICAVLYALLGIAQKYGRVYPSLEGLASLACCSKSTVVRALDWLERHNFIIRHRRIKRIPTPWGCKVVQDNNAYEICCPKGISDWAKSMLSESQNFSVNNLISLFKGLIQLESPKQTTEHQYVYDSG